MGQYLQISLAKREFTPRTWVTCSSTDPGVNENAQTRGQVRQGLGQHGLSIPMDKDGPYLCQCSTPFEGIYAEGIYSEATAITEREETKEEFTSVVNVGLGL